MKSIITLCLLFFSVLCFAQNATIDQLVADFERGKELSKEAGAGELH